MMANVVDIAYQIIDMHRTIISLQDEVETLREYKDKYHKLLDSSISHSNQMIGNTVKLLLTPGVSDILQSHVDQKSSFQLE
jgi:hypothetical protein